MLRKFLKCAAVICAMSLTFSLCGCSDTSWAVKVGSNTMPSGVYLFWLTQVAGEIEQNTSSGVDPWTQTVSGGGTTTTYATTNALDMTEQCAEIENLCAKMKITATTDDVNSAVSFAASEISADSNTFSGNGISSASVQRVYQDYETLRSKLFTAIYGPTGTQPVSDTALKSYYASNYVKIKHIVILTEDSSGNALTGTALTTANNDATAAYNAATANPANFESLMTKYSDDTSTGVPGGTINGSMTGANYYIFSEASAEQSGFDTTFTSTAFSMKVGDIQKVQASYGWDIMLKEQVDSDYTYYNANTSSILQEMKGSDFVTYLEAQIKKDVAVTNDAAINHYNPANLK